MAIRQAETPEKWAQNPGSSSWRESLPHRNPQASPCYSSNEGFARIKSRIKLKPYSEPRIYYGCKAAKVGGKYLPDHEQPKSLDHEWFIFWNHYHPQLKRRKQVKKRFGINYYHTIEERLAYVNDIMPEVKAFLADGGNPWAKERKEKTTLYQALDMAFEFWKNKKPRRPQTIYDYNNAVSLFKEHGHEFSKWPIRDVRRIQIRKVLDNIQKKRKFGNTRYNFIQGTIRTLFGDLIELDLIELNPLSEMMGKTKEAPKAHQPFTEEEKKKIVKHLTEVNPKQFIFAMFIYYTGIRPVEIKRLKIEDIDMDSGVIFLDGVKTKSQKPRVAPIPAPLRRLIEQSGIMGSDPSWHVFGIGFSPSPDPMGERYDHQLWKQEVKARLKINKNQYGLKHTAGDDLIMAGVNLDLIRSLYGHGSVRMTKRYLKREKEAAFKQLEPHIKEFGE